MKIKTVSRLRKIVGVIGAILLILIAITCIIGTYFIGSYIQLHYYYIPKYNSTYNMITGCLLNNTDCNKLSCHEPFYKNCVSSGVFAVLMSIIPIIMIAAMLMIIVANCCGCSRKPLNKNETNNNNKNEKKINNPICNINGDEYHTVDLNENEHALQTMYGKSQIDNNQTIVSIDSNEIVKLSSSSSETSTTKANVSLEYNESQNDNTFISEIEKTGNMSYSG